jgi:hypothetical protein
LFEKGLETDGGRSGKLKKFKDDVKWSIDYHLWLQLFANDCVVIRNNGATNFRWRQHPGQQTRSHGRLSIDNMRKCKCEFIVREVLKGVAKVAAVAASSASSSRVNVVIQVWSVGKTLEGWVEDLRNETAAAMKMKKEGGGLVEVAAVVDGFEWNEGAMAKKVEGEEGGMENVYVYRCFAFGMEKARRKVRASLGKRWRENLDFFVA